MVDSLGHRRRDGAALAVLACAIGLLAACTGRGGGAGPSSPNTRPRRPTTRLTTVYRWGVVGNRGPIAGLQLDTPTPVASISGRVVQIATSNSDGYALTSTGQVYGWGVNSYGELGYGTLTPYETRAVKVRFPAGVKIRALADPMPFDGALAIDSSGHAWAWGLNVFGDLCLSGFIEDRPQRIRLPRVSLATGARTHSLLDSGGAVYACGSGNAGELGNGSTASATRPTPVVGLPAGERVLALTSSWEGSGALLADGSYYDWGYNAAGQLGDGTMTDSSRPVRVDLPGPVRQVFQGGSGPSNGQTIAVLEDGSVWMWGANSRGQLGDGTKIGSDVPVELHLPDGVRIVNVSTGGYASYAVDATGRLWAWGDNREGQLGTGSSPRLTTVPTEVGIHLTQVSSTAQNVAGLGTRS